MYKERVTSLLMKGARITTEQCFPVQIRLAGSTQPPNWPGLHGGCNTFFEVEAIAGAFQGPQVALWYNADESRDVKHGLRRGLFANE